MEPNESIPHAIPHRGDGASPERDLEAIRAWLRSGGHNELNTLAVTAQRLIENRLLATS